MNGSIACDAIACRLVAAVAGVQLVRPSRASSLSNMFRVRCSRSMMSAIDRAG
jgi:hypothetical protein